MVALRFDSAVKPRRVVLSRVILTVCGVLLITAAGLISNRAIERALVSDPTRSLSWGTTLFRFLLAAHGLGLMFCAMVAGKRGKDIAAKSSSHFAESALRTQRETAWHAWLALAVLSVIALGLRMWQLNTDLWFDELLTLLNYLRLPLGDIVTSLPDQNNHLLFSVLSFGSVSLFGESAWAVRLPSVLFGVMSLWALFLLGRRVIGTREALLACALMTLSYHHIWFSQNARGYMALLFFSMLATWLWLEALQRQTWGWWIIYALAVTGGMLSHLTMVFVVSAHFVLYVAMLWIRNRQKSRNRGADNVVSESFNWRPFVAWTLCVSLTLQLYALALPEFVRVGLHEVSLESEWTNPWWVVTETVRNLRIGFSGGLVVLGGVVIVALGWLNLMRREWQSGALIVLPAFIAGGALLASGHNLWPRFFFFAMGFAILIAVHGAVTLPSIVSRQVSTSPSLQRLAAGAGLALAILMILASAVTVPRNYAYPKQDYTGARDYVENHRGPNDAVVAVGLAGVAYERYYAPTWSVAQTESELEFVRRAGENTWLVYTLPVEVKAYRPGVWRTIQSDFTIVKVFPGTLGGGEVVVCRQRPKNESQTAISLINSSELTPQPVN
ncbi:MAG: glycosyltransferase family 39 protein [Pyrinomonadaceae bacterium]|nr:glycosyltransferase family 39 protein [Pyrinomonadaceae bacterium]